MEQRLRWHIYPDMAELTSRLVAAVSRISSSAVRQNGRFRVVLAGGNTPVPLYERLRDRGAVRRTWEVYLGDERCLPEGDPERNDRMIRETLFPDPGEWPVFATIPSELGPDAAAAHYAGILAPIGEFDLVLLGLGQDGHTASLFPGSDLGTQGGADPVLPVRQAPKPPSERVTLSAARLGRAASVFFMVSGTGKREAIQAWLRGEKIPAAAIRPAGGVDVFLDYEAMPAFRVPGALSRLP